MCEDDIFLWPDGMWFYRFEYVAEAYMWRSDDFEIIPFGTDRWKELEDE